MVVRVCVLEEEVGILTVGVGVKLELYFDITPATV